LNVINNIKLAIADYEDDIKLQDAQFELLKRVHFKTGKFSQSVTREHLRMLRIRKIVNLEILIMAKKQLKKELSK
tara:strand:- start:91 stop:315 length:225 start_codon:yes stop_codon:yes gene_type:complete